MSTRVQKGGPIFKPVAKPRARPSSSISGQNSAPVADEPRTGAPIDSMAPPLVVPASVASIYDESSSNLANISNHYPFANPATSSVNTLPDRSLANPASQPIPTDIYGQNIFLSSSIGKGNMLNPEAGQATESYGRAIEPDGPDGSRLTGLNIVVSEPPPGNGGIANLENPTSTENNAQPSSQAPKQGGSRKPRKQRAPSVRPFDAGADPGDEIDPTVVTMAALCADTGQGRVSSKAAEILNNHVAWRASNRDKRARMKSVMEARKFRRRDDDGDTMISSAGTQSNNSAAPCPSSSVSTSTAQEEGPRTEDDSGHGFDYSQDLSTSRFNVQVRIGLNGETFIDEESLFVDRTEEDTEHYTHVEESDNTKFVNSGTYGRKFRGSRWSTEETELFYHALSQFGENYELMSYVLPGRDRKSCKNKFKSEDRKNPNRITFCLNNRIPYDIQTLSRMTGKDFSGPTPEIVAPTPLTLAETEVTNNTEGS